MPGLVYEMTPHEKTVQAHRGKMDDRVHQCEKLAKSIWDGYVMESLRWRGWV